MPDLPDPPDLDQFRRAVLLRDRCRSAAVADGERLGIPLSGVQANVAHDAMVDHIRADERARVLGEVQAALRDRKRTYEWQSDLDFEPEFATGYTMSADYLRDTVGAAESHAEPLGHSGPPSAQDDTPEARSGEMAGTT